MAGLRRRLEVLWPHSQHRRSERLLGGFVEFAAGGHQSAEAAPLGAARPGARIFGCGSVLQPPVR